MTAWVRTPRWSSATPQASPTRAQTRRTARSGGGGEELVGGGADPEVDLAERLGRRDAGRLEVAQVLDAGGDGDREGVDVGGAGLVQHAGVDGDGAPAVAVGALAHEVGERGEVGGGAEPGGRAERVEAEVAADRLAVGDEVEQGAGRAGWSVTDETTTGARSRRTSASTSGRSATAMPSSPTCTHTEVTPCSRSSSTAARVTAASGSSCSWRTSHGVGGVAQGAAAGERHRARDAEVAVLAQVEGVDLEAALEVAAQRLLGLRGRRGGRRRRGPC